MQPKIHFEIYFSFELFHNLKAQVPKHYSLNHLFFFFWQKLGMPPRTRTATLHFSGEFFTAESECIMCVLLAHIGAYENSSWEDESQAGYVRQGVADVGNGVALL